MRNGHFHWILLSAIITSVGVAFAAGTATHKAKRPLNKAESDPDMVVRQNMIDISRELGVTCTHCHDDKNFRSTTLPTWKVAKDHIRVTQLLNSDKGFNGSPKVDCYMCHRGEARPKPEPTPAD